MLCKMDGGKWPGTSAGSQFSKQTSEALRVCLVQWRTVQGCWPRALLRGLQRLRSRPGASGRGRQSRETGVGSFILSALDKVAVTVSEKWDQDEGRTSPGPLTGWSGRSSVSISTPFRSPLHRAPAGPTASCGAVCRSQALGTTPWLGSSG